MHSRLEALLSKLNAPSRRALESATASALLQGQPEVTAAHWLLEAARSAAETDLAGAAARFGPPLDQWTRPLRAAIARVTPNAVGRPRFSPELERLLAEAWAVASLEDSAASVRTGHLLIALAEAAPDWATFLPLDPQRLRREFPVWTAASIESAPAPAAPSEALARYTIDLTAAARDGQLDPVVGRDPELRELLHVLARRRQNNPLLLGDAGVGKTAIVEALALRIAAGEVPSSLRRASLRALDLAALQAGASAIGDLEQRLTLLLQEVRDAAHPVILFADEAHLLFRLGSGAGTLDAVNLLKPALARGELRTIAATTHAEYKRHFEPDAAFARRFQVIPVEEPDEDQAVWMLRGVVASLEKHHHVAIEPDALRPIVRMARRYLAGRQLPDKAIGLLDTAAARVALAQSATPPAIEELRATIARLEAEPSSPALDEDLASAETRLADTERRAEEERALISRIRQQHRQGESASGLEAELKALQADRPLIPLSVDERVAADVVSSWTGIPVSRVIGGERESVLQLRAQLASRIAGQDHALDAIVKRLLAARAGLEDEGRPLGVFLLAGPTGSGKSETPRALADVLYTGERDLITVALSEYQEAHSISGLRGAPPGYVGYGEGGVLTEALRRRPYSIVLLDEVEKAHPDVREFLYEMLDQGRLEDSAGRRVDVRHAVVFLTTNLGAERIEAACRAARPAPAALASLIEGELRRVLRPALLGRVTVIPFYPLGLPALRQIADWRLARLKRRMASRHSIHLEITDAVADALAEQTLGAEGGARAMDRLLSETVVADLSRQVVSGTLRAGMTVTVECAGSAFRYR